MTDALNLKVDKNTEEDRKFKIKAGAFLAAVTGVSAIAGFAHTLSRAKKDDPFFKNNGLVKPVAEDGAMLAMRALGWGTVFAVSGVGLICYGIWKLSGAHDLKEFRVIMGNRLPRITNSENQGRSDFGSFRELMEYLIKDGGKTVPNREEK